MRNRNDPDWISRLDSLHQLLGDRGPMSMREVEKALELSSGEIDVLLMIFPEEFQKLTFVAGGSRSKTDNALYKASPVITLKGDPRIVEFAACHISLKVETQYDAKSVVELLKWQIGYRQAQAVVERLGYHYKGKLRTREQLETG